MTTQDCEKLFQELTEKNGCKYKLVWMKRINKFKRAGECNYKKKIIRLQPVFVELNSVERITNTLLHEIAHALMPKHGHNKFWKRKAIEIGCDGQRCYGSDVIKNNQLK